MLAWEKTQELTSGKVTLRDHHFELPQSTLEGTATILPAVQAGHVTHRLRLAGNEGFELYDYPGGYAERFDGVGPAAETGRRISQRLAAGAGAGRRAAHGGRGVARPRRRRHLDLPRARAGPRLRPVGHFDADGALLLTGVQHASSQPDGCGRRRRLPSTRTRCACIPATLPFRPPRATPQPVVGGAADRGRRRPGRRELFIDRFGRVKVQFHWDREGRSDEHSSCWIRVAQPVGGSGAARSGSREVGDEVLVAFEQGDPDRPYVVGRLFDGDDRPPGGR